MGSSAYLRFVYLLLCDTLESVNHTAFVYSSPYGT